MTPTQSRMARAALGWRVADLAKAASIGTATAARFELGQAVATDTLSAIRVAYERAGIVLLAEGEVSPSGGVGVRVGGL
jgi:transcriptional regulator with XRE-family HTH domain